MIWTCHKCQVVAPSVSPGKGGDWFDADHRGAVSLARLHWAGELTADWVTGLNREAILDLACFDSPQQLVVVLRLAPVTGAITKKRASDLAGTAASGLSKHR